MKPTILKMAVTIGLITPLSQAAYAKSTYSEKDIQGVWNLSQFLVKDQSGHESEWCKGASGTIAYLPGLMTVAINCESTEPGSSAVKIGGLLFYSGPYEVDTKQGEVIHRVRNYSHESLNKVFRRTIAMSDQNHLRLTGALGEGKQAIVDFVRQESFQYEFQRLTGVWELVGSENEVPGSNEKVPFCSGFYGTISYTPGGFSAVSINCGPKKDPLVTEPADQFGRRYFYSGPYHIEGSVLVQELKNASEVSQIGKLAQREMSFLDDLLLLAGTNGSKFLAKWRKQRSFVGI